MAKAMSALISRTPCHLNPAVLRSYSSKHAQLVDHAFILCFIFGVVEYNTRLRRKRIHRVNKLSINFDLPRSALIVLNHLAVDGPMTPKDLSSKVDLAPRTVSFALRKLLGHQLCRKVPNLNDMRQPLYLADTDRAKEIRVKYEHIFRQFLM